MTLFAYRILSVAVCWFRGTIVRRVTLLLIIVIVTVCFLWGKNLMSNKEFLSYDEITDIYNANKELINNIKNGLLSSGFVPNKEKNISLYYENGQLICSDGPQGEKLQIIQNIHDDVIDFLRVNKKLKPTIDFREVFGKTIIEFEFRSNYVKADYRAGIVYTTTPKKPWGEVHLEDNRYAYKYVMP